MENCRAAGVMTFSRELRRRVAQAQRTGRGSRAPGPGRPRARGSCCLLLLLLALALIIYAYMEAYVLHPTPPEKKRSFANPPAAGYSTTPECSSTLLVKPVVLPVSDSRFSGCFSFWFHNETSATARLLQAETT